MSKPEVGQVRKAWFGWKACTGLQNVEDLMLAFVVQSRSTPKTVREANARKIVAFKETWGLTARSASRRAQRIYAAAVRRDRKIKAGAKRGDRRMTQPTTARNQADYDWKDA